MIPLSLPAFLATHPELVLVDLIEAKGSTPREAGAFMLVATNALFGTIGGGQLEFLAIDHARTMLAGGERATSLDVPLGPEIGQCCGGRTLLSFSKLDDAGRRALIDRQAKMESDYPDVFVFGAGHVGLALAAALRPLPLNATLIETRETQDGAIPEGMTLRHVAMPEAEVASIRPGGAAVILTHDHALDFLIAREALARPELAYVGMIGSATKRATFTRWLRREGGDQTLLDKLTLPIGGSALRDKRPPVIAALVAAELLAVLLG
ncbi:MULTISPECIES: xanthine dehydrogenase accessory protein XdhC [Alphaproteobacteria]|uniref:Xanthine dehydrogenase accessory protein XdhC n=2 Tax=Alphaproteobacteria TaxID=28211 RepID=A0A512HFA2_9HYPH|nr:MULTISPECIES: xanthine dehydrogenase accessory protein XdhC [Alphaproteobacteria]GEO84040.1 xanthine dehydrogenase accessory protein XdhC [Ciceribacter naphthalenivorans]GLR21082.1 xanthine dehydrogenase accessory protein XdhC [Ciceribacter naphthalenivorans]GLT03938.1 xanthine dehydrogenase accessory protein XdhC [Sphingomonas psychrolutea]